MAIGKKICLVIPSLQCGGAERVISQLANKFVDENSVFLILLANAEIFYEIDKRVTLITPDFETATLNRYLYAAKLFPFLRRTITEISPDTLLTFGRVYNPYVLIASLGLRIPVFVSDRGNPFYNSGFLNETLRKIIYKKAAGIISQTKFSSEIVIKTIKHFNVKVIPNPIRAIVKHEIQREKKIIFVGRLVKGKGVNYLLNAYAKLPFNEWKLEILGDGPEYKNLTLQAENLDISNRVNFAGKVKDVDLYLSKAEIFVFPSLAEGFPNGLAEAMANGLACISFDCITGPSDLIENGVNGILVKVGDEVTLQKKMIELIENESLRSSLQKKALYINEDFHIDTISKIYLDFITKY